MHKIPWKYGSTFAEICQKYVESVKLHGSESVIVYLMDMQRMLPI